jgi:hypothetical protein
MNRLLAEKMNKEERKNMGEIFVFNEGQELPEYWKALRGQAEKPDAPIQVRNPTIGDKVAVLLKTERL